MDKRKGQGKLPVDRLTAAVCRHRMPLSRAGSLDARGRLLMCAVPSGLLGRWRLRMAYYVTGTEATDRATAARRPY
jgi:hypothetical protein